MVITVVAATAVTSGKITAGAGGVACIVIEVAHVVKVVDGAIVVNVVHNGDGDLVSEHITYYNATSTIHQIYRYFKIMLFYI